MSDPLVSIIIPNLNGADFMADCLRSLLEGRYSNQEVILIDNGSTDSSRQIASGFAPEVRVIANPANLGFSKACNQGIRAAKGTIVVLLNVDTTVSPDWLLPIVRAFQSDPDVVLAGSRLIYSDTGLLQHAGGIIHPNGLTNHIGCGDDPATSHTQNRIVDYACGAALAMRSSFLAETGLLDEGFSPIYYEDTDICVRARKLGKTVLYVADSVVQHHETHTTHKLSFRYLYLFHRNRLRFVSKNYSWRDFRSRFLPCERWWLRNCGLPVIWRPVFSAYLHALVHLPIVLWQKKAGKFKHLPASFPDSLGAEGLPWRPTGEATDYGNSTVENCHGVS